MSAILRRTKIPSTLLPQFVNFASRSIKSFRFPGEPLDSSSITYGIHVFQCPDARGIVAKLSDCIASRGGNILGADIFVPENKEVFYSRSEFIFDHVKWPRAEVEEDFLKLSKTFNAARSVVRVPDLDPKYKIAILASKQEHCLTDMLHVWQAGKLPVEIVCVIRSDFGVCDPWN
ncbi:Formyltetrahydrofolate deformylase 2, mitochondrial [Linum perenne]